MPKQGDIRTDENGQRFRYEEGMPGWVPIDDDATDDDDFIVIPPRYI